VSGVAFKFTNAVYWISLMMWVACLVSAAVAAMGVFGTLPDLGMIIERYRPALGDDPAEHGRLAGGMVMEPVFAATDWIQAAAAALVIVLLVVQFVFFHCSLKSPSHFVRTLCIAGAGALLALHLFNVAPRMNRALRYYWQAIERNDQAAMTQYRDTFNADHFNADRLIRARLFLLLGAVAFSGTAFTPSSLRNKR
jgi:hypothetical protein